MGSATVPGTTYLKMASAAFEHLAPGAELELREVVFLTLLLVDDEESKDVLITLERSADYHVFWVVSWIGSVSQPEGVWQERTRHDLCGLYPNRRDNTTCPQ